MTLSPAAQSVLDAALRQIADDLNAQDQVLTTSVISAALRAAVEQCNYIDDYGNALLIAHEIEAIATELENAS